jgi:hypothetical protein
MSQRIVFIAAFLCIALPGCTWVKLSSEGATVTLRESVDASCKSLGTVTSASRAEIASIDRNEAKVATELATLARNRAPGMGGNVVVAQGPVTEQGEQTFQVYNCP